VPRVDSTRYTFLFAAAVCIACALVVATSAVLLEPRQAANQRFYMYKNVLLAAGLVEPDTDLSDAELREIFRKNIRVRLVDFERGELVPEGKVDVQRFDQRRARDDPATSRPAPPNRAGISRVPHLGLVYLVAPKGEVEQLVLAVEGLGMWGTIYGFVALDKDARTVRGLTYYDQKETPGLGGEIGNPKWQALWRGRKPYDDQWQARITVIKGSAGPAEQDPLRVDGLSGATITSNAVTRLMQFWLGDDGYGRWLRRYRKGGLA
jgi:Na+-transporting NADH:ubiquinone oxidoreductase subunit C